MAKKPARGKKGLSRKVNVDIAPGNALRLLTYMRRYNAHPDRSRPVLTVTDVLNEAMDELFKDEGLARKDREDDAERTTRTRGGKPE
jgi:hypothetical protein